MANQHWLLNKYGTRFDESDAAGVEYERRHDGLKAGRIEPSYHKNPNEPESIEPGTDPEAMEFHKRMGPSTHPLFMRRHGISSEN